MRKITVLQPGKIVFGEESAAQLVDDLLALNFRRIFIVTSAPIITLIEPLAVVTRSDSDVSASAVEARWMWPS